MTNKLNRSDYLILDTLHGSNMTDQFHSMTIEEIMEETGNVLGVLSARSGFENLISIVP